jgi:hypothetical protein
MADKGRSLVVLRENWPGQFRRTVIIGKVPSQLVFSPGEPVEIDPRTARLIEKDIGQALRFCKVRENGKIELIDRQSESESNEPDAAN